MLFQNFSHLSEANSSNQATDKTRTETSALLNNSFVPLQAVKSHINKTSKQINAGIKENIQILDNASQRRTSSEKVIHCVLIH